MKTGKLQSVMHDAFQSPTLQSPGIQEQALESAERVEDELIMHLERDQLVAETSRPVALAPLGARAAALLWALRVFVVLVGLMVIYTFIAQLH